MSANLQEVAAGGVMPPATVKVWDAFVRVFHWSLVAAFGTAYFTGDELQNVHVAAGYTILGLIGARLVWGFIGSHHARFASFVRSPREVLAYLRATMRNRAPRHLGHNPAGGVMIVALLIALVATGVTGYLMTTDAYWGSERMEDLHEGLANTTVGLVALHVIGVIAASVQHAENLVRAMVTGRKRAS